MLFDFEHTTNYETVRSIICHPKLWPFLKDDFSPSVEEWKPVEHENVWYILARDRGELLGLWMFVKHSPVLWEVHTALLPTAGFTRGRKAAHEMAAWMFEHSGCARIMTQVPSPNRAALLFAKAAGMTEYGRNSQSLQQNGRLVDQILLGLSRPKETITCQQQ